MEQTNKEIIPIFWDDSSQKSNLAWWSEKDYVEGGPIPIIKLAKEAGLKQIYFISNNFHTFNSARKITEDAGLELRFGLEMILCPDAINDHTEESLKQEHKVVIFALNSAAYQDLINIYTECHTNINNKYYKFRFDTNQLKKLWTKNLKLVIPWDDSFLAKNKLQFGANIVPDFGFAGELVLFKEIGSNLPFAPLIDEAMDIYNQSNNYEVVPIKSIYYASSKHCEEWITFRTIFTRGSFSNPGIDFCCSDSFNFEEWKELNK